jgi:hypothetical protein
MTSTINIDKDVAIPPVSRGCAAHGKYPYTKMEVGDSFAINADEGEDTIKVRNRLRQSAAWANRRYAPARFSVRATETGVRVWRTA